LVRCARQVLLAVFVLLLVRSGTRYEEGHDWVADNLQKAVGKNLMSPERLAVTFIVVVVIVAILLVLWGIFVAPS
jgi:hypothetical protein